MIGFRYSAFLFASSILITPALAKDESLVDRGKRMCEEAGIPLADCTILPPASRVAQEQQIATTPSSQNAVGDQVPFGTGTYGWCDDCTSFFAAAPIRPWTEFGGREFRPPRDEDDDRPTARLDGTAGGEDQGNSGGTGGGGTGGPGGGGSGGSGSGGNGEGNRGDGGKGGSGGGGKGDRGGGKGDRGDGGKGGSGGGGKGDRGSSKGDRGSGGKGGSSGKSGSSGRW